MRRTDANQHEAAMRDICAPRTTRDTALWQRLCGSEQRKEKGKKKKKEKKERKKEKKKKRKRKERKERKKRKVDVEVIVPRRR